MDVQPRDIKILETVDDIQERREQVLGRYSQFKSEARHKRDRLEESRRFQYFKRDADELESWIHEKLQAASDESYKDATNLQAKIQKHQAFEAEVAAHGNAIVVLDNTGMEMIGYGHFESEKIKQCLDELHRLWELLLRKLADKGQKLQQALVLVQFLRHCDEVMFWINDKETFVMADEFGQDLEHVEVLQRKFDEFQKSSVSRSMAASKSKKYLQVFLDSYTAEFPCFVTSRKGDKYGFCTTCACDVSVSHGGKADIKVHIASQKHQDYFRAADGQGNIGSFFQKSCEDSAIRAECLFTGFLVEHNLPLSVSDHAGLLFRKMFPKCEDTERYGCGRTKTTAIVGEMAAHTGNTMVEALKRRAFALAVDGSNDSGSQMYPIVATYVEESRNVESRLLCLQELHGEATGRKIGNLVLDALKSRGVPIENCIAFSPDNANVMIGKKNGVAAVLKEAQENLIVVGCPCHLINLAAGKGAACLPAKFDEVLVDIFFYLENENQAKRQGC
ncbi:hypothetical protein HPB50_015642 [Hyalomma asiaticum]|uniref:Uncharacterized protein n=1 Tax=Hyalomma asiaticum TaxID=266040 RepID=A0ACB7TIS0_HYAAI|nr:hypothetical protein HPB50_015642 [Hyalomma asiaticum]